jgi:hypothetical protein
MSTKYLRKAYTPNKSGCFAVVLHDWHIFANREGGENPPRTRRRNENAYFWALITT